MDQQFNLKKLENYLNLLKAAGADSSVHEKKLNALKAFFEYLVKHGTITSSLYEELCARVNKEFNVYNIVTNNTPTADVNSSNTWVSKLTKILKKTSKHLANITNVHKSSLSGEKELTPQVYVGALIVFIFMAVLGAGIYSRFFSKVPTPFAYPVSPVTGSRILSYQGRLTDSLGNPITTATNIVFKLYDNSSGGTQLYTSGTCSITPDTDGIFNTLIGSSCGSAIASSVFSENANVWLGTTVGSDTEMTPRQQIANVGYAMNAETLQGLPPGTSTANIPFISQTGDMLIGVAAPGIRSTFASTNFTVSSNQTMTVQASNAGDVVLQATGSGTVRIRTGGTTDANTRIFVDNNGNVGIGTTATSTYNLTVNGTVSGTTLYQGGTAINNAFVQLQGSSPGTQQTGNLNISGTGLFAGNVGVGLTSPNTKLSVNGNAIVGYGEGVGFTAPSNGLFVNGNVGIGSTANTLANLDVSGTIRVGSTATATSTTLCLGTNNVIAGCTGGGGTVSGTGAAGQATFWTGASTLSGSNNFWWDNTNGRLGLGISAPAEALDIGATAANLTFSSSTGPHQIKTGGTTNLALMPGGNVGIGITSPNTKLSVNGNAIVGYGEGVGFTAPSNGLFVNGNVGIGSTANTLANLDVSGTIRVGSTAAATATGLCLGTNNVIGGCNGLATSAGTGAAGQVTYWNGSSTITGNNNFWWDNTNGRLGLGISAPAEALDIGGTAANLTFSSSTGPHQIKTGGTTDLALIPGGNVGIGVTSPKGKLQVNGGLSVGYGEGTTTPPANGAIINGNVGIGTSAPGAYTLNINGATNINGGLTLPNSNIIAGNSGNIGISGGIGFGTTAAPTYYINSSGNAVLNVVGAANGTAAAPTHTFSGDTNTGLFLAGTDALGIASSGLERIRIAGNGNIGIGITSPNTKLSINGNAIIGYGEGVGFSAPSNGLFVNGNVGIGSTASTLANLDVSGTIRVGSTATGTTTGLCLGTNNVIAGCNSGLPTSAGTGASGQATFWTGANTISGSNNFWWDNTNGRLGIGTSAPNASFEVASSITGTSAATIYGSKFDPTLTGTMSTSTPITTFYDQYNVPNINVGGTAPQLTNLYIQYNSASIGTGVSTTVSNFYGQYIASPTVQAGSTLTNKYAFVSEANAGNVGIGITSPTSKLSLNGGLSVGYGEGVTSAPSTGAIISGFVGIGATAPGSKLTVSGGLAVGTSSATSSYLTKLAPDGGAIFEGTVGIGTTTPTGILGTPQLDIANSGVTWQMRLKSTSTNGFGGLYMENDANRTAQIFYGDSSSVNSPNILSIFTSNIAGGGIWFQSGGNNSMFMDTVGNVGLGTTNPSIAKLQVEGTIRVGATAAATNTSLCLGANNVIAGCSGGLVSGSGAAGQATFWTGATTVAGSNNFWWDNTNGRLGLGISAPAEALDIGGTAANLTFSSSTGPHQIKTGSTTDLALMPGANVGIGVTSPKGKLQVNGGLSVGYGEGTTAPPSTGAIIAGNVGIGTSAPVNPLSVSGNANITGNLGLGITSPTSKLSINGGLSVGYGEGVTSAPSTGAIIAGNVGIGTSAPSVLLDVTTPNNPYLNLTSTGSGNEVHIQMQNTGNTTAAMIGLVNTAGQLVTGSKISDLVFRTNVGSNMDFTLDQGSTNHIQFSGNGNIGIGVTNAGSKLQVNGGAVIGFGASGIGAPTNGMFISGNVGIGSTATTLANLDVSGTIRVGSTAAGTSTSLCLGANNVIAGCAGALVSGSGAAGQATFWTGASTVAGSNNFWWDNTNGRLGLGISAPAEALDIGGTAANLTFSSSTGPHQIKTGGTTDLALMPGGNVGIGVTSPKGKLQINGGLSVGFGEGTTAPPSTGAIIAGNVGIGSSNAPNRLYVVGTNTEAGIGNSMSIGAWTTAAGWTESPAGQLNHTTGNTADATNAVSGISSGILYQLTYTLTTTTPGDGVTPYIGTTSGTTQYYSGSQVDYIRSSGGGVNLIFRPGPSGTWVGNITNIVLKPLSSSTATIYAQNSTSGSDLEIRSGGYNLSNAYIGTNAGKYTITGNSNIALGSNALTYNVSGNYNSALGWDSLFNNTTGSYNTALGFSALAANTTTNFNTAVGTYTLASNTTGYSNTALGSSALQMNTSGYQNTAIGVNALVSNTSGYQSSSLGLGSLQNNTSGFQNTAIGYYSQNSGTTGAYNTSLGTNSLQNNRTGIANVAVGFSALGNTLQTGNSVLGYFSLNKNTTGINNSALGYATDIGNIPNTFTASTAAGSSLGIGTYYYKVSFTINGLEGQTSSYVTVTTTSGNQNVNLSSIPTYTGGLAGSVSRKIYRTKLADSGCPNSCDFYLAGTLSDNIGTTLPDTTADASLGSAYVGPSNMILLGSASTGYFSNQMVIGSSGSYINDAYLGSGIEAGSPQNITLNATGGLGSNVNGASLILAGGKATGNALGGALIFKTSTVGSSGATQQTLAERMRIDNTGNVGIGFTSPTYKLDVNGTIRGDEFLDTSGVGKYGLDPAGSDANFGVAGGTLLSLATAQGASFGGNVGIGTTNPGGQLELAGSITGTSAATLYGAKLNPTLTGTMSTSTPITAYYNLYNAPNINVGGTTPNLSKLYLAYNGATIGTGVTTSISTLFNHYLAAPTVNAGSTVTNTYALVSEAGAGNIGFGTTAPAYPFDLISPTSPQMRIGYDTSNYLTTSLASNGDTTFNAVTGNSYASFTGTGADGAITISTSRNINSNTIAAGRTYADGIAYKVDASTFGSNTVTAVDTPSGIAAGDEVLLINLQGVSGDSADVGKYEFLKLTSVNTGTKVLTFTTNIVNHYSGTTASNQKVVVQRVPNYTNVTIAAGGVLTASAWDALATTPSGTAGYKTGIIAFRATGTVYNDGSITASQLGFRGGVTGNSGPESYIGYQNTGGGNGGNGGLRNGSSSGGGGGGGGGASGDGGNASLNVGGSAGAGGGGSGGAGGSSTAGGNGSSASGGGGGGESFVTQGGAGGGGGAWPYSADSTVTPDDFSKIYLGGGAAQGGGGGGGGYGSGNTAGLGGNKNGTGGTGSTNGSNGLSGTPGGGAIIIYSAKLANDVGSTMSVAGGSGGVGGTGGTGQSSGQGGGGGGGGSGGTGGTGGGIYIKTLTADLGINSVNASGGSGGAGGSFGLGGSSSQVGGTGAAGSAGATGTNGKVYASAVSGVLTGFSTPSNLSSPSNLPVSAKINFNTAGNTVLAIDQVYATIAASMINFTGGGLRQFNNTGNIALMTGTGFVGINTTAPSASLTVNGDMLNLSGVNGFGDEGSMVPNAGFEINNDNTTTVADGWTGISESGTATFGVTAPGIAGDKSQNINNAASSVGRIYSKCIPFTPGNQYYGAAVVDSTRSSAGNVYVGIEQYTSSANCASRSSGTDLALTSTTAAASNSIFGGAATTASNTIWGRVYVRAVNIPTTTATTFTVDSIRVVPGFPGIGTNYSADLAEAYGSSDPTIEAGDIVSMDSAKNTEQLNSASSISKSYVLKATNDKNKQLLGVVSTNPNTVMGKDIFEESENPRPIALSGRVPVKVNTMYGAIYAGDPITVGDVAGYGVKAVRPSMIIGRALETYDPVHGKGTAVACPAGFAPGSLCGTVNVFINTSWYNPDSFLTSAGDYHISVATTAPASSGPFVYNGNLDDAKKQANSLSYIVSNLNGDAVTGIGIFTETISSKITAGIFQTENAVVNGMLVASKTITDTLQATQITTTNLATSTFTAVSGSIQNLTASQITVTDKIVSPIVETEQLNANKVTAKNITSDTINTNEIKPTNNDVVINLNTTVAPTPSTSAPQTQTTGPLAKLLLKGKDGNIVSSFDAEGNATFSGTIASAQIDTDRLNSQRITTEQLSGNEASISGTLAARQIKADNIDQLASQSSTLATNYQQLTTQVNDVQKLLADLQNQPLSNPQYYQSAPSTTSLTQCPAGQQCNNGTMQQFNNLTVTGSSNLYNVTVANSFIAGNVQIQDNAVTSLSWDLKLSALASINMFDGAVVIAKDGTITTQGTVIAKGGVKTNTIESVNNQDINVRLTANGDAARIGSGLTSNDTSGANSNTKLQILNDTNSVVASIDASGSARFNSIALDKYTSATSSAAVIGAMDNYQKNGLFSAAIETQKQSAGNGVLPQNEQDIVIYNGSVKSDSMIYLTPTSSTEGTQLSVTQKVGCSVTDVSCRPYFKVHAESILHPEILFDWLIIN